MDPNSKAGKPFPDCFYCLEKKAVKQCSSATARLDMEALATEGDAQSLWANTFSAAQEKKKYIVIVDWRLAYLSEKALQSYNVLLNSLFLGGFSIYLLQQQTIEPLYFPNLQLQQLKNIKPLARAKVYKIATAALAHSAADEILLYDFYKQKQLAEHFGFLVESNKSPAYRSDQFINPSVTFCDEFIGALPKPLIEELMNLPERQRRETHVDRYDAATLVSTRDMRAYEYSRWYRYTRMNLQGGGAAIYSYGVEKGNNFTENDVKMELLLQIALDPSLKSLANVRSEDEILREKKLLTVDGDIESDGLRPEWVRMITQSKELSVENEIRKDDFPWHAGIMQSQNSISSHDKKVNFIFIYRCTISSFSWVKYIDEPTHLMLMEVNILQGAAKSCEDILNPYITRFTINGTDNRSTENFKLILKTVPQLKFLTILFDHYNEEYLRECLQYLPPGCQFHFDVRSAAAISICNYDIGIKSDLEGFKKTFNRNLNLKESQAHFVLENHEQGIERAGDALQQINASYKGTSNIMRTLPPSRFGKAYRISIHNERINEHTFSLCFPQLNLLEFRETFISNELLLHIISKAPQLQTLILESNSSADGLFGSEIVIKLMQLDHFERLRYDRAQFTPLANELLDDQKNFYCEPCSPAPVAISFRNFCNNVEGSADGQVINHDMPPRTHIPGRPKPGITYSDQSHLSDQFQIDGKIALQKLSVYNNQPYFINFPEDYTISPLRQGLFYLDGRDQSFKNVSNIQGYQTVAIKINADTLHYRQNSYLEDGYIWEHYNPALKLTCKAGVRVSLYNTSPQDVLVALAVRPLRDKAVPIKVEKGTLDGLYYLTTEEDIEIMCEFVMATPPQNLQSVPEPLQRLAGAIQKFGIGTQDLPENESNEARLNRLWESKKGACRHRTQVLLHQAAKRKELSDIQLYMAVGSNHAWPEWRHTHMAATQNFDCLGGYPGEKIYRDDPRFDGARDKIQAPQLSRRPLKFFPNQTAPTEPKEKERLVRRSLKFLPTSETAPIPKEEDATKQVIATANLSSEKSAQGEPEKKKEAPMRAITATQCLQLEQGKNYLVVANDFIEIDSFINNLLIQDPLRIHTVYHGKRLHTVGKGLKQVEQSWIQSEAVNGALNHFLSHLPPETAPIFVLKMLPEDLVKYNSLFDSDCKKRRINGVAIPQNAIILTLVSPDSDVFEDNSILSRQHETLKLSTEGSSANTSIAAFPLHTVSLYGTDDWEAWLLGYCIYNSAGRPAIFNGYLLEALNTGASLRIIYPPQDNYDFDIFVKELNAQKGFWFLDKWYAFPQGVVVDRNNHYDFSMLYKIMQILPKNFPLKIQWAHHHLINSHTFERCLRNTVMVENIPCQYPGWIGMARDTKALSLYISDHLSIGQWYCLLETCAKHKVTLTVQCAPGVNLPDELSAYYPLSGSPRTDSPECSELESVLFGSTIGGIMVYSENHLDSYYQCQEQLNKEGYTLFSDNVDVKRSYLCIEASELTDENALYCNQIYKHNGKYHGHCAESDILKLLEEGGTVVLTGNLQPALLGHLSTLFLEEPYLWVNGAKRKINGRLIIIPEKGQPLSQWIDHSRKFTHPVQSKPIVMPQATPILPTKISDNLWWSENEFKAVLEARKEFVLTELEHKPFIFLQGPAGSGKSSLALQLQNEPDIAVYHEEDIIAWAKDTSPGKAKILFIDEANLRTQQQWTLFQGLFNNPPGIYYNQKFYPLTPDHKVIFAGNPLDHGGKRIEPILFKRYPECTLHCPLLPAAYIEHAILRDIFRYIPKLAGNVDLLAKECRAFLQDYDAERDSIRSLQSRAMLHGYEQIPELNREEKEPRKIADDYVLLKSRQSCQQAIIDSLKIQQFKRWAHAQAEHDASLLDAACYGGHSGVLIEGAPDTGKTALIKATLVEQGYSEVTLESASRNDNTKMYYVMDPQHMDEILDRAFQEGAVLVWDEINSYLMPALTAKLNSYLSGYSLDKKAPKKAGFTLLSSINPAYMQGRVAIDTSLCTRLEQQHLKKYQDNEITEILEKTAADLPVPVRATIAQEFFEKRQAAIDAYGSKPGPRYLQQLVEKARAKLGEKETSVMQNHSRYFTQPAPALPEACGRSTIPQSTEISAGVKIN